MKNLYTTYDMKREGPDEINSKRLKLINMKIKNEFYKYLSIPLKKLSTQ